jgi:hypothetical protein
MAVKIVWTHQVFGDFVEVMAIAKVNEFAFAMSIDEEGNHSCVFGDKSLHENLKDAFDFIKERSKPVYYQHFNLNYELEYVDKTSQEWYDAHTRYNTTMELIREFNKQQEFNKLPWYKKLFKRI